MKVNEKGQFIGKGEETALSILKDMYGESAEYTIQVPFRNLLNEEWQGTLTERQEKETLDIVVKTNLKTVVFRIQDAHHRGMHTAERDLVQKKTLEWNGHTVVDLWDHDCPELFKEKKNAKSIAEVKESMSFVK
tara:strand:- start:90 stop:491 length:402 start_codon:yes stop_codon:yes gene_type:complete